MELLGKLLLGVDFEASSSHVVQAAIDLAKTFQATVVPLYVLPHDIAHEKVKRLLVDTANLKLDEIADRLRIEGVKVEGPILLEGIPHEVIPKLASETRANLIVLGSGAPHSSLGFRLGTTAERVIQKSEKPVLIIKEGQALEVNHMLCPVDFSTTAKRALRNAITMARRFNAELSILAVCEQPDASWFSSELDQSDEMEERMKGCARELDAFLDDVHLADLNWTKKIVQGKASDEILNLIHQQDIDLLVMGTVGRTGLHRLIMGSVAEKVVRELPCSFITLKSEDVISLQLKQQILDIEERYALAMQFVKDGFFEEACEQLKECIRVNPMHVPSYQGLVTIYEKINEQAKAQFYSQSLKDIKERIWYSKIEEEIRTNRHI